MINDIKYHKNLYESLRRFELDCHVVNSSQWLYEIKFKIFIIYKWYKK